MEIVHVYILLRQKLIFFVEIRTILYIMIDEKWFVYHKSFFYFLAEMRLRDYGGC